MHGITEEFYGSLSSKKPFNCLEKLDFVDMPEWKQWHVLGIGEFPTLEEILINNCPELNLETPIQLSSLKRFEVSDSPKVGVVFDDAELFRSQLEEMKQIEELRISDCNSLTSFPFSILPTTLKRITISCCRKLKLDPPVGELSMLLEELRLEGCNCIDDISHLRARSLSVYKCHNLTTVTERLHIWNFENVEKLSVACDDVTDYLGSSSVCQNIYMQELFPSLKGLYLDYCPEIESFPQGGFPFNLQLLCINDCTKLVNGRKEWRLQILPCLRELAIYHDGSDKEILAGENWELPSSIQTLTIWNLKTLSSQHLKFSPCWNKASFRTSLRFKVYKSGIYLISNHFLNQHCPPPSLIYHCPNLQSLPVKGMPSSLSELYIHECPLLKPLLEFDKGEYWPNIAQFPTIEIDGECM